MSRKRKHNKKKQSKCVVVSKIKHKKNDLTPIELNELCNNIKFSKQKIKIIGKI